MDELGHQLSSPRERILKAASRKSQLFLSVVFGCAPAVAVLSGLYARYLNRDYAPPSRGVFSSEVFDHVSLVAATLSIGTVLRYLAARKRRTSRDHRLFTFAATDDGADDGKATAGAKLRRRAQLHRTQANLFLALLCTVIISTTMIYVFAEQISGEDPILAGIQRSERLLDVLRETNRGLTRQMFLLTESVANLGKSGLSAAKPAEVNAVASDLASLTGQDPGSYTERANKMQELLGEARSNLDRVRASLEATGERTRRFASSIATRVGAVLMMIFLAQFLIATYRYTMRLSAAYDAKADAIQLADETDHFDDPVEAKEFTAVDAIVFGEPKAPTQQLLDAATEALKAASAKKG